PRWRRDFGSAAPGSFPIMHAPPESVSIAALTREALLHADSLYNLARRLTGSTVDAEDLVQDTYARALGASELFTPGTNLRAWLFRILRNAHIDRLRRHRADPMGARLDAEVSVEQELLPYAGGDGEQMRRLVASEIEAALRVLPDDARTVILLD